MKEYKEALELGKRACTGFRSWLGPEHRKTKNTERDYSRMLDKIKRENQGKVEEENQLLEQAARTIQQELFSVM
jgi:hypothetical protein